MLGNFCTSSDIRASLGPGPCAAHLRPSSTWVSCKEGKIGVSTHTVNCIVSHTGLPGGVNVLRFYRSAAVDSVLRFSRRKRNRLWRTIHFPRRVVSPVHSTRQATLKRPRVGSGLQRVFASFLNEQLQNETDCKDRCS